MAKSSFVRRLEQRMIDLGLKQLQVEKSAGLSRGYLTRILSGEREKVRLETSQSIADALGVRREWLFDGEGPMTAAGNAPVAPLVVADPTPKPPATRVVLDVRYPNLAQAMTALMGRVDDAILNSFHYYDMKSDDDLSFDEWVDLILDRARRVRKALDASRDSVDLGKPLDD